MDADFIKDRTMLPKYSHVGAKRKPRLGQALVEYIVIVAAVAMTVLLAVSVFGHKVADQYAISAGILPGAHAASNAPIVNTEFAGFDIDETTGAITANGEVSWGSVTGNMVPGELENNVLTSGYNDACTFVCEDGGGEEVGTIGGGDVYPDGVSTPDPEP